MGVALPSLFCYSALCGHVVFCARGIFAVVTPAILPFVEFQHGLGPYLTALAAIIDFFFCRLVLAGIEFTAELALWRRRPEGDALR